MWIRSGFMGLTTGVVAKLPRCSCCGGEVKICQDCGREFGRPPNDPRWKKRRYCRAVTASNPRALQPSLGEKGRDGH